MSLDLGVDGDALDPTTVQFHEMTRLGTMSIDAAGVATHTPKPAHWARRRVHLHGEGCPWRCGHAQGVHHVRGSLAGVLRALCTLRAKAPWSCIGSPGGRAMGGTGRPVDRSIPQSGGDLAQVAKHDAAPQWPGLPDPSGACGETCALPLRSVSGRTVRGHLGHPQGPLFPLYPSSHRPWASLGGGIPWELKCIGLVLGTLARPYSCPSPCRKGGIPGPYGELKE